MMSSEAWSGSCKSMRGMYYQPHTYTYHDSSSCPLSSCFSRATAAGIFPFPPAASPATSSMGRQHRLSDRPCPRSQGGSGGGVGQLDMAVSWM